MTDERVGAPRRRYVRFTRWRRRRFFGVLTESGNVQLAAEAAGVALATVYLAKKREAEFAARWAAAVEAASAGLEGEAQTALTLPPGRAGRAPPSPQMGEGHLVIRRGRKGRLRLMAAGTHWWSERHDAMFLAQLRMTGNVAASARAIGFTPKSAWNRRDRLAGFAREWDAATEEADSRLEWRLIEEAKRGTPMMIACEDAEEARFDPWLAMWLLKRRDQKAAGTLRRGAGWPRREPDIEEVRAEILRKVAAVERHRERFGEPESEGS